MNFLTHPFTDDLREMNRVMTRLFGDTGIIRGNGGTEQTLAATWAPSVDIEETDNHYLVRVEIPQVKKEDVKITIDEGVLAVSGERRQEKEDKGQRYHRIERSYGAFYRSFRLPDDVDVSKIEAKFDNGMLNVTLPRKATPTPSVKQIPVH